MLNINHAPRVTTYDEVDSQTRIICISRAVIYEFESKDRERANMDVSLHDAKLETLKTRTKTINLGNGKKCKAKVLSFERSDGVKNEVTIFGEEY